MIKGIIFGLEGILVDSNLPDKVSPSRAKYEMLMKLRACELRLAVCSLAPNNTAGLLLLKSQLRHFFHVIMCNQGLDLMKPSPEMYNRAIDLTRLPADQCVIVESGEENVAAAEATGAHVLPVASFDEVTFELFEQFFEIRRISGGVIEVLEGLSQLCDMRNNRCLH